MSVLDCVKKRPITSIGIVGVSAYCFWQGYVINHYVQHFSATRLKGYAGPLEIASLRTWSFAYAIVGFVLLLRLYALRAPKVDLALHVVCMIPVFGWAVAFDLGPATTGQPSYTFVATVLIWIPLITRVFEMQHRHREEALRKELLG